MKILSILVGQPKEIQFRGQTLTTSIFKSPIPDPAFVGKLNIEGDKQADLTVHGGPDKAVYAYSFAAHDWWKKNRPDLVLGMGAFGENLTLEDINEDQVFIGDTFKVGKSILQVTQPRLPCGKLGVKFNDMTAIKSFSKCHRPGVYFRVIQEGLISRGNRLELISQEKALVSVNELADIIHKQAITPARAKTIFQLKSLPEFWKEVLEEYL